MASKVTPSAGAFRFLGNHPALDFLNTAPREQGEIAERLTDYATLVTWLEEAGLVVPQDAAQARARWKDAAPGGVVVARARALRELLREVVTLGAGGGSVSAALLVQLNEALREEAGSFTEVRRVKEGFERRARLALDAPGEVLSPLLRTSAELLTEVDLTLVRKCADPACVLFFHDISKNHARQWCSMENCGNRHKVSAFRSRAAR